MTGAGRRRSMPGTSPAIRQKANQAIVVPFPKKETSFLIFQCLTNVIKGLWPKKTAAHVAHLTGTSERTVRFWLACQTRMSLDAVVLLLRTDDGYQILEAVMGDSKAEWWLAAQAAQNIRRSRKAIKREQERIAQTRAQLELLDQ